MADMNLVSHCYERMTFKGWHYNLFAMMHSKSIDQIHCEIDKFVSDENINTYELLPTVVELKKQPVKYNF